MHQEILLHQALPLPSKIVNFWAQVGAFARTEFGLCPATGLCP
jgi:hypothetical protein